MTLIPRTRVFWIAWCATALSLLGLLYVPVLSEMFKVERPAAARVFFALLIGTLSVGWRLSRSARRVHG